MKIKQAVENAATFTDLKRTAKPYVIDFRGLNEAELKEAIIKTAPQYYYASNVQKALNEIFHSQDRTCRIIAPYFLRNVLLQKDGYLCRHRDSEDLILKWEQSVVDQSNEDLLKKSSERSQDFEFFQFVLGVAWEQNDDISLDEFNLLEKIANRLKITSMEYRLMEAKLGKFPTKDNVIHTRSDIQNIRRVLQETGLVFQIRDREQNGEDFDVVPSEVADAIKEILGIEIREYGYSQMLTHKIIRSKKYLMDTLSKCDIKVDKNISLSELYPVFIEQVSPKILLGGLSPRDGLAMDDLKKWCNELNLNVSGSKSDLIDRIVGFYDGLNEMTETEGDPREGLLPYFELFASRNIPELRSQLLIEKDLEMERKFEECTNYIFEKIFGHKPLNLVGTAHADGALSYKDKVIYWDNKSKESPVNLKDHIRQFDQYIQNSEKSVAGFMVIGPSFTQESSVSAMQYQVDHGTMITLITASELLDLATRWQQMKIGDEQSAFPLGYLLQTGRFNPALVAGF